nr:lipid-A-disaccharide synthase [Chthoniobacterales bacterium]
RVTTGTAALTMQRAQVGVVASGTATLEAAFFRLPFVLVYRVAWPTYIAARMVVKVKHLGMPNVLAGKEVVRELIQHHATPHAIEVAVMDLLEQPRARDEMVLEFDRVVAQLGDFGASERAATAIFELLNAPSAVA